MEIHTEYYFLEFGMLRFPSRLLSSARNAPVGVESQTQAMKKDLLIVVNRSDEVVGSASKWKCHLVEDNGPLLHRAFSLFVFDAAGRLMITRRSPDKITFPNHWSNTVCSHPLHNHYECDPSTASPYDNVLVSKWPSFPPPSTGAVPSTPHAAPFASSDSHTAAHPAVRGAIRAAARRAYQEIGLALAPSSISAHGRIIYSASNRNGAGATDASLAEAEIDYLTSAVASVGMGVDATDGPFTAASLREIIRPFHEEVDGVVWLPPPSNSGFAAPAKAADTNPPVEWLTASDDPSDNPAGRIPMAVAPAPTAFTADAFASAISGALANINVAHAASGGAWAPTDVLLTPWFTWCVEDPGLLARVWQSALAHASTPSASGPAAHGEVYKLRTDVPFGEAV